MIHRNRESPEPVSAIQMLFAAWCKQSKTQKPRIADIQLDEG
jgi:hypothetical protein